MSLEAKREGGNAIKGTVAGVLIVAVGYLGLSAAKVGSTGRSPDHIEFCSENEENGFVAGPGSEDENDPEVILRYAQEHRFYDQTAGLLARHSSGAAAIAPDYINGLGEEVCQTYDDDHIGFRFLPSIERVREAYRTDVNTVQRELYAATSTTIG